MTRCAWLAATLCAFAVTDCDAVELCAGVALAEVQSLAQLPPALRQKVAHRSRRDGSTDIADRGKPFNPTDVADAQLPMQRFFLAGLSSTCAVIAVEQGGLAHHWTVTEFRWTGPGWQQVKRHFLSREPQSLQDLTQAYTAVD